MRGRGNKCNRQEMQVVVNECANKRNILFSMESQKR